MMKIYEGRYVLEGAGVRLYRVISDRIMSETNPFLMLDYFSSDDPEDYKKGFPWHPHRGMSTLTYMIRGEVEHQDSLGNKGTIKAGEVQFMKAGSGIIHQEMPNPKLPICGMQLWINLSKKEKMTPPIYNSITEIPQINEKNSSIKVIAGKFREISGPVSGFDLLDADLGKSDSFSYIPKKAHSTFIFILEGAAEYNGRIIERHQLALVEEEFTIKTDKGIRFILTSGKPIEEPVAWGGPIVMNTDEELMQAYKELEHGSFIKKA